MTVIDGERERRMVFGEVADLYERVRPGYPAELIRDVLAYGSVVRGDRVLEVGAGTGKATRLFAAHGLRMVCLEPSAPMAAIARHRCAGFPDVCFEVSTFEDWPLEEGAFRLLVSAQAWHWVSSEVRCPKAHAALARDGALALFWNRPQVGNGELRAAFDEIYDRFAPTLRAGAGGTSPEPAEVEEEFSELERGGLFVSVTERHYAWSEEYPGARYLSLLRTQSDHRLLEERTRHRLLDALGRVIAEGDGGVTVDYETKLYLALRS